MDQPAPGCCCSLCMCSEQPCTTPPRLPRPVRAPQPGWWDASYSATVNWQAGRFGRAGGNAVCADLFAGGALAGTWVLPAAGRLWVLAAALARAACMCCTLHPCR